MSSKKDPRRVNLVVPYQAPNPKGDTADVSSSMSSIMPMVAMLTRNRYVGWGAVLFSLMSWMGESEDVKNSGTPGYFGVGMSVMALIVTYIPLFMPVPGQQQAAAAQPVAVQ